MQKPEIRPSTLCMAPWTHTYISPQCERRICCASREPAQNFKQYIDTAQGSGEFNPMTLDEHWNSEHMKSVRKRMMFGETLEECDVCNSKLLNTDVYRSYFSHLFNHLYDDIWSQTDSSGHTTMKTISWDYRYSNICNFKCRMCGDMLSSSWESEALNNQMVNLDDPKNNWLRQDNRQLIKEFVSNTVVPEFMQSVEDQTIREIYWVGGEPLLYPQHWQAMQRIVELNYADQVRVRYNTNLSQINYKGQNLYDILGSFRNWEICASLDGTGAIGEYVRTGLVYSDWLHNFKMGVQSQKYPGQMRIDFTLTLPGMVELENIISLADTFNVRLLCKVVFAFSPDILLSPLALPRTILDTWIDNIKMQINQKQSDSNRVVNDMLDQLKQRKTFEEEWGVDHAKNALQRGKQHLLKLESIRKDTKITMEEILENTPARDWWHNL